MVRHHCQYAYENGHKVAIQHLITELGCDPALPDNNGDMPIHLACRCGQLSVVKYLVTEQHCRSKPVEDIMVGHHCNMLVKMVTWT